jgi:hypothetical protein
MDVEKDKEAMQFEEVLDTEIDDLWDLFFPYMIEKKEKMRRLDQAEKNKPRRHLRFLTM